MACEVSECDHGNDRTSACRPPTGIGSLDQQDAAVAIAWQDGTRIRSRPIDARSLRLYGDTGRPLLSRLKGQSLVSPTVVAQFDSPEVDDLELLARGRHDLVVCQEGEETLRLVRVLVVDPFE